MRIILTENQFKLVLKKFKKNQIIQEQEYQWSKGVTTSPTTKNDATYSKLTTNQPKKKYEPIKYKIYGPYFFKQDGSDYREEFMGDTSTKPINMENDQIYHFTYLLKNIGTQTIYFKDFNINHRKNVGVFMTDADKQEIKPNEQIKLYLGIESPKKYYKTTEQSQDLKKKREYSPYIILKGEDGIEKKISIPRFSLITPIEMKLAPTKEDVHTALTWLSVGAFFAPVVGPFLSAGLQLYNAKTYYDEGKYFEAGLEAAFAIIPLDELWRSIPGLKKFTLQQFESFVNKWLKGLTESQMTQTEKELVEKLSNHEALTPLIKKWGKLKLKKEFKNLITKKLSKLTFKQFAKVLHLWTITNPLFSTSLAKLYLYIEGIRYSYTYIANTFGLEEGKLTDEMELKQFTEEWEKNKPVMIEQLADQMQQEIDFDQDESLEYMKSIDLVEKE